MSKTSAWATARVQTVEAIEQDVLGITITAPAETVVWAGEYADEMPDVLVRIVVAIDEDGTDRTADVASLIVDALTKAAQA